MALDDGDEPFGSILVGGDGATLYEDRNRVKDGDHTRHPEFAIARWAVDNMAPDERARATVYTSGEHCPMCAAGHAWVGLGRIVYAASSSQLSRVADRVGVAAAAGGPAARHDRRTAPGRRRARTRARRRHEGPVPGEVPAMTGSSRKRSSMTEPAWVEHAIWWQVYPLGFVGAFPAEPPPTADEHRLRPDRRLARPRHRTRRVRYRAGPGVRVAHARLRHHRPLPHRPAPRRRRRLRPADRRGPRARVAGAARRRVQPRRHRLRALSRRRHGVVSAARQRLRHLRGPRRADRAGPRQPRCRRPTPST